MNGTRVPPDTAGLPTRRRFVIGAGGALLVAGCASEPNDPVAQPAEDTVADATPTDDTPADVAPTDDTPADDTSAGDPIAAFVASDFADLGPCLLLQPAPAGPFPLDRRFDREDITEGYPGHPLRLGFRVVDRDCRPAAGATVEIWHCDATGDYSAFTDNGGGKDESEGTTFLRGTRTANADGIVEFHTIYPGWYPGRAVHLHLTIQIADGTALTSQLYFDDDYTADVYSEAPYAEFGIPDTATSVDFLAGDVIANGSLLAASRSPTRAGDGTTGLSNLVVGT